MAFVRVLCRRVYDLFHVLQHDIRVSRAFDDDRFDVQIQAASAGWCRAVALVSEE